MTSAANQFTATNASTITLLVNGAAQTTSARTLAQWLDQQGENQNAVATALNGQFVPRAMRPAQALNDGDAVLTFHPIEGG